MSIKISLQHFDKVYRFKVIFKFFKMFFICSYSFVKKSQTLKIEAIFSASVGIFAVSREIFLSPKFSPRVPSYREQLADGPCSSPLANQNCP